MIWDSLGFSDVFTANSHTEAVEILEKETGGSGNLRY